MPPVARSANRASVIGALIAIYVTTLAVSLYRIDLPLLEFFPVRQVQTAEITRNLYRADHNLLYPSRYEGRELKPFVFEFPFYNAVVAVGYAMAGGAYDAIGRVVSIASWLGAGVCLFLMTRRYYGDVVALATLFFFHMSRLGIMTSRSFQPDAMMVCLSIAALLLWDRWSQHPEPRRLVWAAAVSTLALLVKIPIAHTALPVLFLIWLMPVRPWRQLLIAAAVMLAVVAAWYLHARAATVSAMPSMAIGFTVSDKFSVELLTDPAFYNSVYVIWRATVFGTLSFVLVAYGALMWLPSRRHAMFHVWLAAVVAFLLFFNYHALTHEYYHLPLVAVGSVFAGRAFAAIPRLVDGLILPARAVQVLVAAAVVVSTVQFIAPRAYRIRKDMMPVLAAAEAVKRTTATDALIITNGAIVPYLADRKGWMLWAREPDPIARLEAYRQQGAALYVVETETEFRKQTALADYVTRTFPRLDDSGTHMVFDLTKTR